MDKSSALETTGQDWANHLSHAASGNGMTYLVATLSQAPDAALLRQAVEDVIELQPVLGCRFDETAEPPVWAAARGGDCLRVLRADELREGLEIVTQDAWAPGRAMQAALICTRNRPAICLRFDHAATDGGGAVRCLALLARCYRERLGGSRLAESLCLDRSDRRLYARCGLADPRMAIRREGPVPKPLATVPYAGTDGRTIRYLWSALPLSAVRKPGGTVNDRLLAAYALALSRVCGEGRCVSLHMTVDLRRYLAPEETPLAANLSGMEAVHLEIGPRATFPDLLAETAAQTALLKTRHAGLSSAATMTYLRALPYEKAKGALIDAGRRSRASGEAAPILSNLGHAFPEGLTIGDAAVTSVFALLPVLHAPAFMLGAIGYADALTLSAGIYAEERSPRDVERVLGFVRDVLMGEG